MLPKGLFDRFSSFARLCNLIHLCALHHGRPHIGANGSADPPGKMDEKLKSENIQKRAVIYVYVIF